MLRWTSILQVYYFPQRTIYCKRANLVAVCLWLASDNAISVSILAIVKPLARRQGHVLGPPEL